MPEKGPLNPGSHIETPLQIRRKKFELLKNLFGLDMTFDEILWPAKSRKVSLVRSVLMWAHTNRKEARAMFNTDKVFHISSSSVYQNLRRFDELLVKNNSPLLKNKLELLRETALFIENENEIPPDLLEKIRVLRAQEAKTNTNHFTMEEEKRREEHALYGTPGLLEREDKAFTMMKEGKSDESIREALGISPQTLKNYKRSLIARGVMEKSKSVERAYGSRNKKYRGTSPSGDVLLELDSLDKFILKSHLAGMDVPRMRAELRNKGTNVSRGVLIGRAWRMFGGLNRISKDRVQGDLNGNGEVIYEKPKL